MRPRHTTPRRTNSSRSGHSPASSKARKQNLERRSPPCLALERFEPEPGAVYNIETAARLTGIPRRMILVYCKYRLVAPVGEPYIAGYWFTRDAILSLREIQEVRVRCRDEVETVATILSLLNEIKALRAAIRARRLPERSRAS